MTPRSKIVVRKIRRELAALAAQEDGRIDLARAALLIAAEEQIIKHIEIDESLAALDRMGAEVRRRIETENGLEPWEILNHFLFAEMGFAGNQEDYYDPRNSLLNVVLERRTGIPLTLSLIYMEVGKRAGIEVEGVGMPGHFIVRVKTGINDHILVDPFHALVIDEDDCQARLDQTYAGQIPLRADHLRAATTREILVRLLSNLKAIYLQRNLPKEALATVERILLLMPGNLAEHRDRGLLLSQLGRQVEALPELKFYLRSAPENDEPASQVREALKSIHQKIASLN